MQYFLRFIRFSGFTLGVLCANQLSAAAGQWTDLHTNTTYDGTTPLVLTSGHSYQPTGTTAWVGSDVTLPPNAVVTVGAPSDAAFLGNTYTALKVVTGTLNLSGTDGRKEIITLLTKTAKGTFTINDRTSGGLTISTFTATGDAEVGNITINSFGVNTVLSLGVSLAPSGSAAPLTLNIDESAVITLTIITSIPRLTGKGRIILGASLMSISSTEIVRISGFKGEIVTASGGTTDLSFTSDALIWTLSGVTEVQYAVIKLMKGTVRLPASTKIIFSSN